MNNPISVPSARGMGSAFGDYAVGAIGGLIFSLSQSFLGKGFFGSLVAPVLTGSMIKGTRGTALATVAGYNGIMSLLSAPANNASTTSDATQSAPGVM